MATTKTSKTKNKTAATTVDVGGFLAAVPTPSAAPTRSLRGR